jgi:molecular chaperone IbpA
MREGAGYGPSRSSARPVWLARNLHVNATLLDAEKDADMRTIDFSPLYRSVVGFDRLAEMLSAASSETDTGYPPYNIERTEENAFRIEIAVAGFRPDELDIELKANLLTVQGRKTVNDDARRYIHRGLSERGFERRFQLADYVIVAGAELAHGILTIDLKREVPELLKPRHIDITLGDGAASLGQDNVRHLQA